MSTANTSSSGSGIARVSRCCQVLRAPWHMSSLGGDLAGGHRKGSCLPARSQPGSAKPHRQQLPEGELCRTPEAAEAVLTGPGMQRWRDDVSVLTVVWW